MKKVMERVYLGIALLPVAMPMIEAVYKVFAYSQKKKGGKEDEKRVCKRIYRRSINITIPGY